MIRLRFLLPLILFVTLVLFFWLSLGKDPNLLPSFFIDKPVPQFSARSLEDPSQLITNENLKGKISIVNVWATWCDGCQSEHPLLIDLINKPSVQVIGLNYKDKRVDALQYLSKMGNPYKYIIDDKEGKLAMQFGVYGTPETFLIDQNAIVRYCYVGPLTLDLIENDLLPRIAKLEKGSS